MGIPGAGKTRVASGYVDRGYARLNRDVRGGSLRDLAEALDESLAAGAPAAVLDNTYLTRASRSHVLDIAARHGVRVDCVWLDIAARAGAGQPRRAAAASASAPCRVPRSCGGSRRPSRASSRRRRRCAPCGSSSLRRPTRASPGCSACPSSANGRREAPPACSSRAPRSDARAGDGKSPWPESRRRPTLLFDWSPDGRVHDLAADGARLAAEVRGPVETALCPHGGGPPICWCRPPLPGLLLAFARAHDVDAAASVMVGASPAHRTLAEALGARYLAL